MPKIKKINQVKKMVLKPTVVTNYGVMNNFKGDVLVMVRLDTGRYLFKQITQADSGFVGDRIDELMSESGLTFSEQITAHIIKWVYKALEAGMEIAKKKLQ